MKQSTSVLIIAVIMIFAAAVSRVLLYPVSFSPLIAMALFGGAVINNKKLAFLLPLLAIFLSDVLFEVFNVAPGFYGLGQVVNYVLLMLVAFLGTYLKKLNLITISGYTIASCLIFYSLSNSSVFLMSGGYYPKNFSGYMECMIAGLPFLKANLISTASYSLLFFGAYFLATKYFQKERLAYNKI